MERHVTAWLDKDQAMQVLPHIARSMIDRDEVRLQVAVEDGRAPDLFVLRESGHMWRALVFAAKYGGFLLSEYKQPGAEMTPYAHKQ